MRCGNANGRQQVDRPIGTDAGRWSLRSDDNHRFVGSDSEVKKERRLFQPVCAVCDNDAGNVRTLIQNRIDPA
jgi:hypothetical protein